MNLHSFWDQGAEAFQNEGVDWINRPLNDTAKVYMEAWAEELMAKFPPQYY